MYSLDTIALIKRVRGLGIELTVDDGKIRYKTSKNSLTTELSQNLAANRVEILQFLQELQTPVNSIPAFSLKKNLPVSFSQQRFWMLEQNGPEVAAPNIFFSRQLSGPLKYEVLEQSLDEVVKRHQILRTVFVSVDGRIEQHPRHSQEQKISIKDLQNKKPDEIDTEISFLLSRAASQSFDLQSGPLFRCGLLRKNANKHILFFVLHPAIADEFSCTPLFREIFTLYSAFCRPTIAGLPNLPVQFSDYTIWQLNNSDKLALEDKLDYWKKHLGDTPARLVIPNDPMLSEESESQQGYPCFHLENNLINQLNMLAKQERTTLSTVLLTCLVVLLRRYGNSNEILVGLRDPDRHHPEVEQLIGPIGNTLVLRIDTSGSPDFLTLLRRIRETSHNAHTQAVPVEHLIHALRESSDPKVSLPFQILFEFRRVLHENPALDDLKVTPLRQYFTSPISDLALSVDQTDDGISGVFRCRAGLTTEAVISRMTGHLQTLLKDVADNPGCSISKLQLLTRAEQQSLLVDWNNTDKDFPHTQCLHQLFEAQVERTPDHVAVVYKDETLTFSELNSRANQLAHYLRAHNVGPEVLVGICVTRSMDMVVGILGVLKSGAAYVPMDPGYPGERLAFMLADSGARILLTQKSLDHEISDTDMHVVYLDSDWPSIASESEENPGSGVTAEDPVYVIYTSGSTGNPKGVVIIHRGIVNYLSWAVSEYDVLEGSGSPLNLSFAFDASITSLFTTLLAGKPVVLLPEQEEIDALVKTLRNKPDFSFVKLTPSHLVFLNTLIPAAEASGQTRALVVGGEALLWEQITFWLEHAPGTRLINEYGPTEASVACCIYTATTNAVKTGSVPIGRPIANTKLYILDEYQQPVPIGVTGELYISGEGIARGYLNQPELTAEKFIRNPFNTRSDTRIYKSGDLVRYRVDGVIEYLGRTDDQVKIRGYRVELGEIEAVLTKHPKVKEAVVACESNSVVQLVAYIVGTPESLPDSSELRRFLREKLPEHMVPSAFTKLDSIPLTAHGKVDRRKLAEQCKTHSLKTPDNQSLRRDSPYIAPRDLLEYRLAEICSEIFNIGVPIGVQDNFFDIGGDSMSALVLVTEIDKVLDKKIPLSTIFQSPSIEQIAVILKDNIDTSQRSSLVPIQTGKDKPPVFLMHFEDGAIFPAHFRFARMFSLDQPVYGLQAKGVDGTQKPYENMEEIATSYVDDICTSFPEGPHHLIGICHGAPLVFEVAQQLYKRGVTMGVVALIMPATPCLYKTRELMEILERPYSDVPAELQRVVDAQHKALLNYRPKPFPGKILYLESMGPLGATEKNTRSSWAKLAAGGMTVHKAPCNHGEIFNRANLKMLAYNLEMLFDSRSIAMTRNPENEKGRAINNEATRIN